MAKQQYFTPKGIFKFAHLNKPDTKFKTEGEYKVTVVFEKSAAAALIAKLDKLHAAAYEMGEGKMDEASPKVKAAWKKRKITEPTLNPYYEDEVDENGDPTGRIEMRFKTRASFEDRKTGKTVEKKVKMVDGRGQVIPEKKVPLVYGGTEGRIAFSTADTFIAKDADVYLGLYLNEVQITKLVTSGAGTSSFGADEDSDFSSDDLDEYEGNTNDDDSDLDGDLDGADDDADLDDEIPF